MKNWKIRLLSILISVAMVGTAVSEDLIVYASESIEQVADELATEDYSDILSEEEQSVVTEVSSTEASEPELVVTEEEISESEWETESSTDIEGVTETDTETLDDDAIEEEFIRQIEELDDSRYLLECGGLEIYSGGDDTDISDITLESDKNAEITAIILDALENNKKSMDFPEHTYTLSEFYTVYAAVKNYYPEYFYITRENDIKKIDYSYEYINGEDVFFLKSWPLVYSSDYDLASFNYAVNKALNQIDDSMNDMEKALVLHDYIVMNCGYNKTIANNGTLSYDDPVYDAYGVFVNQDAVCNGYALAYQLLLRKSGIDSGFVLNVNHAWNYVWIDGRFYNVDTTWDDPIFSINGTNQNKEGMCSHKNFLISDEACFGDRGHINMNVKRSYHGYEVTDMFAMDTRYDNAYWGSVDSQYIYNNGSWYYLYNNALYKGDILGNSKIKAFSDFGIWRVFGDSSYYYTDIYSGLFSDGSRLYINKYDGVYAIEFGGTTAKKVYSIDTSKSYLWGVVCRNDIKNRKTLYLLMLGGTNIQSISSDSLGIVRNEFTVTYYGLHGEILKQAIVKRGQSVTPPEEPVENGYFFNNWSASSTNVTMDLDIYPNYGVRGYSITYYTNGGTNPDSAPKNYNIITEVTLPTPSKAGYNFDGWYDNSSFTGRSYTKIEKGNYNDKVFYAKWTAKAPIAPIIEADGYFEYSGTTGIIIDEGTNIKLLSGEVSDDITIYYSTSGASVTQSNTKYTAPFAVTNNVTVRARAYRESSGSLITSRTVTIANNKISLVNKDMVLKVGDKRGVFVNSYPTGKTGSDITWTSGDTSVATVDALGYVTAVGEGQTVIHATTTDWRGRTVTAEANITVAGAPIVVPVGDYINDDAGRIIMEKGTKISIVCASAGAEIYYTTSGLTPSKSALKYTAPFAVNEDTSIKAIAYIDNQASNVSTKEIVVKESKFSIDTKELSLEKYDTAVIKVTTLPTGKTESDVRWSSDDISVAEVDSDGTVTAVGAGQTIIHAKVKNWKGDVITLDCSVNVSPAKFDVIFRGFNGIQIDKIEVNEGESVIAPDVPMTVAGYTFTGWDKLLDNIRADLVINAVYVLNNYTITYNANGGSIDAYAPTVYNYESDTIVLPQAGGKDGYIFAGWYDNEEFGGSPVSSIPKNSTGDRVFYAKWRNEKGLWMQWKGLGYKEPLSVEYTGKAIKPEYEVYYGDELLSYGIDYSVTYKNNINVWTSGADKDRATMIVVGKGNYAGKVSEYFTITPKSIESEEGAGKRAADIDVEALAFSYNGRMQQKQPKISWNGKALGKKDIVVTFPDTVAGAYTEPGKYNVTITGTGNYSGTVKTTIQIVKTDSKDESAPILISKCKAKILPFVYSGDAIDFDNADRIKNVTVKLGNNADLVYGKDYTLIYGEDYNGIPCREIGTYTVIVRGMGQYCGELRCKFSITGTAIKTAKIEPISQVVYDGKIHEPELTIYDKTGAPLVKNKDYSVSYSNNMNVGTAQVVITGIGAYTGTVKKTFKITQLPIQYLSSESFRVSLASSSGKAIYEKAGARPKLVVTYDGSVLQEGTDYTVVYKNNGSVNPAAGKIPTAVIKGKKNYKGTREIYFSIEKADIGRAKMELQAVVVSTKAGKYMSSPVITDINGKRLAKNVDYEGDIEYRDQAGNLLNKYSLPKAGDIIVVTVKGKNNYEGTITGTYKICEKGMSLASARITVRKTSADNIYYTGQPVTLNKSDVEVVLNGQILSTYEYEILEGSYVNNINKGTAKVTIVGTGRYTGYKTISFRIKPQSMNWWTK